MASEQFSNDASSTLVQAVTSTSSLTIKVNSNTGFPSSGNFRLKIDSEELLVTQVGLSAPPSAPTVSGVAGSTSYHAGTFTVGYTYNTVGGESALSATANASLTAGQAVHIGTISSIPSYVTSLNFYFTAVPAGDTTGFIVTATPSGGIVSAFNLTAEGNGTSAPGSSPSTVWVVQRGVETTTAATHANGAPVVANLTAAALTTAFARIDQATGYSGPFHAEAYRNAALSIGNGFVFANLPFDTVPASGDPNGNYNTSSGFYTCPLSGLYRVTVSVIFSSAAGTVALNLLKNGVAAKRFGTSYNGVSNPAAGGSAKVRCNAGDTLSVQVAQSSATNPAPIFTGQDLCYAEFELVNP